jgi:Ser/Thr protein kinase RdoA (MazF antagonist)
MPREGFDALPQQGRIARLAQLARAALEHWRLADARLSLLKYRENAVFAVTDPGLARRFVLRVHRSRYHSDAELRSELQWMAALIEAGIETPPVVPTTAGDLFVNVSHPEVPEPRQCDLLGWVEGDVIGNIEGGHVATADDVRTSHHQAGRLAALIHNHGERWSRPAGFTRPTMDFEGLVGERAYLGPYAACPLLTRDQIAMLDRARDGLGDSLTAFGRAPDRFGLTHGDFLPENLLRHGETVRIIDFDDCGFGWYVMDIATSLLFLLGEPHYDDALTGFVAGYRSARPLPDEHLVTLPSFLLARAMTYVGWCGSRPEAPIVQQKGPVVVEATLALAEQFLAEME